MPSTVPSCLLLAVLTAGAANPPTTEPPRAAPAAVQDRKATLAEYDRRWAACDKKDAAAILALMAWCADNGLADKQRYLARKVLRLEPDNEVANGVLGKVRHKDRWVTPGEKKKLEVEEAEEEARRAAEAERLRILNMRILPDEVAAKRTVTARIEANDGYCAGLVKALLDKTGAPGGDTHAAMADRTIVIGDFPKDRVDLLVQIGEYSYRRLCWLARGQLDADVFATSKATSGRQVCCFCDPSYWSDTNQFLAAFFKSDFPVSEAKRLSEDPDGARNLYWSYPGLPLHSFRDREYAESSVANATGHQWLYFTARAACAEPDLRTRAEQGITGKHRMHWLAEGLGVWTSLDAIGKNEFWRVGSPPAFLERYAKKSTKKKTPPGEQSERAMFREVALDMAKGKWPEGSTSRSFYELTRLDLYGLEAADRIQAWSFVDYLLIGRTPEWRALVALLAEGPSFRTAFVKVFGTDDDRKALADALRTGGHDHLLDDIYARVCGRFDEAWKAWVLTTYTRPDDHQVPFPGKT
ncbi:MAG: hypothetical protein R3F30_02310 [Planctomycetota bacterium]